MGDEKKQELGGKQDGVNPRRSTELAIFGSREHSNRGNAIQIRETVRTLRANLSRRRMRDGVDAHEFGTELVRLFQERADEVLQRTDFLQFAKEEFDLGESSLKRYVRVARYATAAQAAWGVDAVLDAASIVDLFASDAALQKKHGLKRAPTTITDIAKVELEVAGGKIRLADAPREALVEEALLLLREARTPGARRLPASMREKNAALKQATLTEPELLGVKAQFVERGGKRRFDVSVPPGANLTRIARALERVLERLG